MRPAPKPLVPLLLLLACVASPLRAAPVFQVIPDTLRADSLGSWHASLLLVNDSETGLYPDSLSLDWRTDDADVPEGVRSGRESLHGLVRALAPAGAGERTGMDWVGPARFERGTLTFRLQVRDAKKQAHVFTATAVVAGNEFYERFPPVMTQAGGQPVEVIHMPTAARPSSAVLYVPPAGTSARAAMRGLYPITQRGHAVSIVSLPGDGRTAGTSDAAGPASVAAVEAALALLAKQPDVDGRRLAIWGVGDGGTAALLAAARHPELLAVIAQDAGYDPWATYRALPEPEREGFVRMAGRDSSAWRARSALAVATQLVPPVLVIHTAEHGAAPAAAFVAARLARQLPVESRINGQEARPVRRMDALRLSLDFLARRLRWPE